MTGGTITLIAATSSEQFKDGEVLLEPPESRLPENLLVLPALVRIIKGMVYVPIINVGTLVVMLFPHRVLGTLSCIHVVSLPAGVTEVQSNTFTQARKLLKQWCEDK